MRAAEIGVLLLQVKIDPEQLLVAIHIFAYLTIGNQQFPWRWVELGQSVLQFLYLKCQLFALMLVLLCRLLKLLPLSLDFLAEFSDRNIVGVESLLFLPEIVLHRSDLALNILAIGYLLVNWGLFIPNILNLSLDRLDQWSMINSTIFLSIYLYLIGSDLKLQLLSFIVLLFDENSSHLFQINLLHFRCFVGSRLYFSAGVVVGVCTGVAFMVHKRYKWWCNDYNLIE